jgi:hypothetical protein
MRTVPRVLFCLSLMLAGAVAFAQSNPVPFVNQPLVPMTAAPGGSGFTLTVNGTEFVSSSIVNWNGTALATTFVSSLQLTATVPAPDIATPGTASVTVSNPPPGGGTSNVMYFDVANQASSLVFSNFYSSFGEVESSIIAVDFNGDGKLDLASVGGSANVFLIELGNGDGTFQAPLQYPVGNEPSGVFAADFNGDGKLDVAVVNSQDNTVSILLGNGDGTFQAAKSFATGGFPFSVTSGDFNGDGKLDLAVACGGNGSINESGSISILLGNGDGTFQNHVDYTPPGTGLQTISAMTMGDFNGDGNLDAALVDEGAEGQNDLFILLGNGDGTFQFNNPVPIVGQVLWMLAADVNGDGKLDLVNSLHSEGDIAVLIGNGDGTFQPPVEYSTGGNYPLQTVAGDLNADGKLDLAVANEPNDLSTVAVLLGNGDGTFQSPITFSTDIFDCGVGNCFPFALAVGDFNGDGEADLAATLANTPNDLLVLLQGDWPALAAIPPGVDFGQLNVGTSSAPQSAVLTNTGNATFEISSLSLTGTNPGDFSQNNNCGSTLAPNASCQVNVTFTPSLPGTRNAAISVTSNSFKHPIDVPLTGVGYGVLVSLSPQTVIFPNQYVGTSGLPQSVQLNNTGNAALTITNVTASPGDFAPLSTCGNSLGPGSSCSIGVFFDPATSGPRNGILTVTDSASDSPQTASLTGVGQDFSMALSSSSTATVSPGQMATYTVTVAPDGGFNQTVLLSCSGAPIGSTCSASPSSATLNGSTPVPVTVTVTTAGASADLAQPAGFPPAGNRLVRWLSLCVLPGLVVGSFGAGQRNPRWLIHALAFACLLLLAITWSGCGGGGSGSGTAPGTYNLTVTGSFTAGSVVLKHTVPVTLIVQ